MASPNAHAVVRDHRFAIVVGIDAYPGYRDLSGACNDAEAFAEWVTDGAGGAVPQENVRVHLGRRATDVWSARPIKRDIDFSLHQFLQAVRHGAIPARLYLYFAGHGVAAALGTATVLMADAAPGMSWNLSLDLYRSWLLRCRDFTEVALFSDCCRTITLEIPEGPPPFDTCAEPYPYPQRAFVALAADLGRPAFETRDARGQFTSLLLEGLRGGAADPLTGEVRADGLAGFLDALAERSDPPQRAETAVLGEPLHFATVPLTAFTVQLELGAGPTRAVHVLGAGGDVVASADRPAGPWSVELARGLYELDDPVAGAPVLFKVDGPDVVVGT